MKVLAAFGAVFVFVLFVLTASNTFSEVSAQDEKKRPEIITLGTEAKLGTIKFSHIDHITKNRSIEGVKIMCIECHHAAQPAAEAAKHPPLKTVWPVDRTTTLTAALFDKDPNGAGVAACRDCHARAEMKPKLLPEMQQRHRAIDAARLVVERHGGDTLSYFALRDDKHHVRFGDTLIAYAVRNGVCLVSPDPIGPPSEHEPVWAAFHRFARFAVSPTLRV